MLLHRIADPSSGGHTGPYWLSQARSHRECCLMACYFLAAALPSSTWCAGNHEYWKCHLVREGSSYIITYHLMQGTVDCCREKCWSASEVIATFCRWNLPRTNI